VDANSPCKINAMLGILNKILGGGRFPHLNYEPEILIVNLIFSGPI
jgi:hypothetical protein